MMENAKKILKDQVDQYEIYEEETLTETIDINKDKISFSTSNETKGVAIRVAIGKKLGFAYTNNANDYKNAIKLAIKTAKLGHEDKNFESFAQKRKIKLFNQVDKKLEDLTPEDISKNIQTFISEIKSVNKNIQLSEGSYHKGFSKYKILNSEGIDVETLRLENSFDTAITMKKNGKIESIDDGWASIKPLEKLPAKDYAKRLISQLDKQKLKTGNMQLILHPDALASLLNVAMMFNVNGENVIQGKSQWKDSIGKQIFDKKITIKDDGISKEYLAGRPFDDEGIPTQVTPLVDKGILKNHLHNSYTAKQLNVQNTGNAYRAIPLLPKIDGNSIVIGTGKKNCIDEADNAILVRGLLGTHTMNQSTGDFSLGVMEGYKVEKGSIGNAVTGTMIAGNILDLMKKVLVLGKKQQTSFIGNGYYTPEMLFEKIKVIS